MPKVTSVAAQLRGQKKSRLDVFLLDGNSLSPSLPPSSFYISRPWRVRQDGKRDICCVLRSWCCWSINPPPAPPPWPRHTCQENCKFIRHWLQAASPSALMRNVGAVGGFYQPVVVLWLGAVTGSCALSSLLKDLGKGRSSWVVWLNSFPWLQTELCACSVTVALGLLFTYQYSPVHLASEKSMNNLCCFFNFVQLLFSLAYPLKLKKNNNNENPSGCVLLARLVFPLGFVTWLNVIKCTPCHSSYSKECPSAVPVCSAFFLLWIRVGGIMGYYKSAVTHESIASE